MTNNEPPSTNFDRVTDEIYADILDFEEEKRRRGYPVDDEVPPPDDTNAPVGQLFDGNDPRPQIVIGPDLERVIREAEKALLPLQTIYVRGRKLARVVRDFGRSDWIRRPDGCPVIVQLRLPGMLELLSRAALWISAGKKGASRAMPPGWAASLLLDREEWSLPQIEGVSESPVFRPDGTILEVPGYDPATRLLYDPRGITFPSVPSEPTHAQATRALADLLDPFSEFPFVDDAARSATAALILSIMARSAILGEVPLFSAQAPTPGSGKGLLIAAASLIATGHLAPLMAQTSEEEEVRKRLLAIAIESPQLIVIDNVEGTFGSPALAMAITTGEIRDRKLGTSDLASVTLRAVWAITGNNIQFRHDFGRRVVPIDLDPQTEHPEHRKFQRGNLLAYIEENRPRLVTAALTVLRAYKVAGCPDQGLDPVGSFEAWDHLVRRAIYWARGSDPMGGVPRIQEQADDDVERIRVLLYAWRMTYGGVEVTVPDVIRALDNKPELRDALSAFCKDGKINIRAVGYAFRKTNGRIVANMRLRRTGEDRNHNSKWAVDDVL